MTFKTNQNKSTWNGLCAAGKIQISASVNLPKVPRVQGEHFHVEIVTYVPAVNPDAAATVDQLVAILDAEWPGVMRSRPEPTFCHALKAQK
jgi:hypothetical protein